MNGGFPCDTLLIEIVLPILKNFTFFFSNFFFFFDFFNFSIYILRIYLQSWSNLLIVTNPRFFPLINESILSARAPSCTIYLQPNTN